MLRLVGGGMASGLGFLTMSFELGRGAFLSLESLGPRNFEGGSLPILSG